MSHPGLSSLSPLSPASSTHPLATTTTQDDPGTALIDLESTTASLHKRLFDLRAAYLALHPTIRSNASGLVHPDDSALASELAGESPIRETECEAQLAHLRVLARQAQAAHIVEDVRGFQAAVEKAWEVARSVRAQLQDFRHAVEAFQRAAAWLWDAGRDEGVGMGRSPSRGGRERGAAWQANPTAPAFTPRRLSREAKEELVTLPQGLGEDGGDDVVVGEDGEDTQEVEKKL